MWGGEDTWQQTKLTHLRQDVDDLGSITEDQELVAFVVCPVLDHIQDLTSAGRTSKPEISVDRFEKGSAWQ